jgi:uncharacterized protein YcfJ
MLNDRLVLVGVAALSAVATAGWMRPSPVVSAAPPQAMHFVAPGMETGVLTPASATPVTSGVYHQAQPRAVRTSASTASTLRTSPRVYDDRRATRAVYDDDRPVVTKKRSTAKSAAIIGGSAAAGAAVGAMAGGGKGAAIGALAGGAGGYIYDRMTKNK